MTDRVNIITSTIIPLHGAAVSMSGGRPENQDDLAWVDTPLGFLLIVCDGMGGGPGGRTASYTARTVIVNTILDCNRQTPRDYALKMAIAKAEEKLEHLGDANRTLKGMGTTVVVVLVSEDCATIAHLGDSRCYVFRKKKFIFRTQDHSLVAELVKRKVMTEEEARISPQSNVITRGLGYVSNHAPEIDEIPYRRGDRFVICTDGVWGSMPARQLIGQLTASGDLQSLVVNLQGEVDQIGFSKGGGHDNHTLAVFDMEIDSKGKGYGKLANMAVAKRNAILAVAAFAVICIVAIVIASVFSNKGGNREVSKITSGSGLTVPRKESQDIDTVDTARQEVEIPISAPKFIKGDTVKKDTSKTKVTKKDSAKNKKSENKDKKVDKKVKAKNQDKNKTEKNASNDTPGVIAQRMMNRYGEVKNIEAKTQEEAQKAVNEKKKELVRLAKSLVDKTKGTPDSKDAQTIFRAVDNSVAWYIGRTQKGKYSLTGKAKSKVDEQIERLSKLKKKLNKT